MNRIRNIARVAATLCLTTLVFAVGTSANHSTIEQITTGPAGGNGGFDANFAGVSSDGTHAFFTSSERIVSGDTDSSVDIYDRSGGTTSLVSTGPAGGNGTPTVFFRGASADGTHTFFLTSESLVSGDTDTSTDVYDASGGTTSLVSTGPNGGNGAPAASFAGASGDGRHVFIVTVESLVSADTDTSLDIYDRSAGATTLVSTGPAGGNGAFSPEFGGASSDGSAVFFTTQESLVSGDTDSSIDVYRRSGSTTTLMSSPNSFVGNGPFGASFAGASSDGGRVFFTTREALVSSDTDSSVDIYAQGGGLGIVNGNGNNSFDQTFVGSSSDGMVVFFTTQEKLSSGDTDAASDLYQQVAGTTTLLSTGPAGGNDSSFPALFAGASSNGADVFFTTSESLVAGDAESTGCGTFLNGPCQDVYQRTGSTTTLLSTSPSAGNGPFDALSPRASSDGSRVFFETTERLLPIDTDAARDVYERFAGVTTLVTIGPNGGNAALAANLVGISSDGTRAFLRTFESLLSADTDTHEDIYQAGIAITTGYPRPRGASPLRMPLVPAYAACATPNQRHGAPLSAESCNPPQQLSDFLTVGTPDANGQATKSVGYVRLDTIVGNSSTPADEADAKIAVSITDVRNKNNLSDYIGETQLSTRLRITDTLNGTSGHTDPGTTTAIDYT